VKLAGASNGVVMGQPTGLWILLLAMLIEVFVLLPVLQDPDQPFGDLRSLTALVALALTGWCAFRVWRAGPLQPRRPFKIRRRAPEDPID